MDYFYCIRIRYSSSQYFSNLEFFVKFNLILPHKFSSPDQVDGENNTLLKIRRFFEIHSSVITQPRWLWCGKTSKFSRVRF